MINHFFYIPDIPHPFRILSININNDPFKNRYQLSSTDGRAECRFENAQYITKYINSMSGGFDYKYDVMIEPKGKFSGFFITEFNQSINNQSNIIEISFSFNYYESEYEDVVQRRKRKLKTLMV
jgi:hypothetical protein